jgi:hypothetical protein
LLGLSLLLAGARRTARRGREARRGLKQSRRETAASQARDDLINQRDTARAYTASSLGNGTPGGGHQSDASGGRWNRLHLFGPRPAHQQAAGRHPESPDGQAASDLPADPPISANSAANGSRP